MRYFNIAGKCYPQKHYMVDLSQRAQKIRRMIDDGKYFCINKGRQYGKTTTLSFLKDYISDSYIVFSISFEALGDEAFLSTEVMAYAFIQLLENAGRAKSMSGLNEDVKSFLKEYLQRYRDSLRINLLELSNVITELCNKADKPIVLLIDEVDQAGNFSSFIKFLGMLRNKYLEKDDFATFQSVILASVYDIKNLKLKMHPDGEYQYNSPWNIASNFDVTMDFSVEDIMGMLSEYEKDHRSGMDIHQMARLLYDYTSGYPFLVSKLCKMLDETEEMSWNRECFQKVLKTLLNEEKNTLFDDMIKKLQDFPEMKEMFRDILYNGRVYTFAIDDNIIDIASMFGLIRNADGVVKISNRIFETRLYNLFMFEESKHEKIYDEGTLDKNRFIKDGHLDMKHVLERFVIHYTDIYGDREEAFHEKEGRKFFMFYLKPIINGTGNYYIEAETRDATRTDMVVDYQGEQFVIEMKIWRGDAYNARGEQQLIDYLDYFHTDKGYMLSFNFNKKKSTGIHEIQIGSKTLIEAVV